MALHAEETQTCLHLIAPKLLWQGVAALSDEELSLFIFFFFTCANKAIFIHSSRRRTQRSLARRDSSVKFPFVTSWQLGNTVVLRKQNLDKWGGSPRKPHLSPFISTAAGVTLTLQVSYCDSQKFPYTHTHTHSSFSSNMSQLIGSPPPRLLNCQLCGVSSLCRLSRATWTEERVNT